MTRDTNTQIPTITNNTATLELLRTFAVNHGEIAFAHLVTAAINGEEWAVARVAEVLDLFESYGLAGVDTDTVATKLEAIRAVDTTRPDGATARSFTL